MAVIRNGWTIYFHPLFAARFAQLRRRALELEKRLSEEELERHPDFKLYETVNELVNETVPNDPERSHFRQGLTLGEQRKSWRRVKGHGLGQRHRLFFRFATQPVKVLIFVWLNDDDSLRKAGSVTDVYATFGRMLGQGNPPNSLDELMTIVLAEEQKKTGATGCSEVKPARTGRS